MPKRIGGGVIDGEFPGYMAHDAPNDSGLPAGPHAAELVDADG